jgi:flagellar basal body rod protein FlgG
VKRGDQHLLTRSGNFHLSASGSLQTAQGDSVLSSGGDPIQLNPALPWRVLPGAVIDQGSDRIEVGLVRPKSLPALQKVGENYFRDKGATSPVPAADRRIRSGYLEMSSVKPVEEMVELIAASRAYEANVRVIQQHDTATSELISRMLRV